MTEETQTETMINVEANTQPQEAQNVTPAEAPQQEAAAPSEVEYLYAGKYKTAEDLEKGYKEVVKKMTEKNPGAPEEYEFDLSVDENLKNYEFNLQDDPTYQALIPKFKELNLTQEQANVLVSEYLKSAVGQIPDLGDEMKKLGPDGQKILDSVNKFVSSDVPEQFRDLMQQAGQTAEGVQMVEWVMKGMMRDNSIPSDAAAYAPRQSYQEVMAEAMQLRKSTPNFEIDKKAQARYEQLMDSAVKLQTGSNPNA